MIVQEAPCDDVGMAERPLLIFVSDIHLTDRLHGNAVSKAEQFARFWERIQLLPEREHLLFEIREVGLGVDASKGARRRRGNWHGLSSMYRGWECGDVGGSA